MSITIHCETYAPTKLAQMKKVNDRRLSPYHYFINQMVKLENITYCKLNHITPLYQSITIYQFFWYPVLSLNLLALP